MKPLYVHGSGFWMPGHADLASYLAQAADAELRRPDAALLTGPSKRRSSLLTRMAVEAFGQAAVQAGADPASVASVWAIVHGEIATAVELMGMMHAGEGKLSPTKFHNSVYNTASGYASIACGNRAPSTTLTGGWEIVGAALVEAAGMLHEGATQVVVVWADEPHPPPFESLQPRQPLALALCLSLESRNALACIAQLRRQHTEPEEAPGCFEGMYVSAALPLLERIERRVAGGLSLERGSDEGIGWTGELLFP